MAELEEKPHLLTLPPEIREEIYRLILNPAANRLYGSDEYTDYNYVPALVLFQLSRQIYYESRKIFRDVNTFVRIETPWPEAQDHVAFEGHVPILLKGDRAASFTFHSLSVIIKAPYPGFEETENRFFVILLDDLDKFTKTWFYADLSNPGLNGYLGLTLQLRDPYTPDWDEKRIPKWLQRQLVLPFGMVKQLGSLVVEGDPKPFSSIEAELRKEMAVPLPSPEHCLSEATHLKLEGNKELTDGNFEAALKIYSRAWEAIHIVVKGRQRHIHAEAFFARELQEEPFKGKNGQLERLNLRVQLVANTCLAYMKMGKFEEVRFWGMRTIRMMRQATGANEEDIPAEDEAMLGFPGAVQMGKIYYRTAVAVKELGDKSEARKLLRVAAVYLPRDENVRKELAACALRIL